MAKDNLSVFIPADLNEEGGVNYGLVNTSEGYYYSICSHPTELDKCPQESTLIGFLDKILLTVLNDSEVRGLCINPYSEVPCFIPQEYIKIIFGHITSN